MNTEGVRRLMSAAAIFVLVSALLLAYELVGTLAADLSLAQVASTFWGFHAMASGFLWVLIVAESFNGWRGWVMARSLDVRQLLTSLLTALAASVYFGTAMALARGAMMARG